MGRNKKKVMWGFQLSTETLEEALGVYAENGDEGWSKTERGALNAGILTADQYEKSGVEGCKVKALIKKTEEVKLVKVSHK